MNEQLITPQTLQVAVFIVGLTGTLVVVEKVLNVVRFFRKEPPDHCVYASKAEVEKLDKKLLQTETKLETQIAALNEKISEQYASIERSDEARTSGLHNRMNTIAENVANLTGQLKSNAQLFETIMKGRP